MKRGWFALIVVTLVAACVGPPQGHRPQGQRPPLDAGLKQCLIDLDRLHARYTPLPDQEYGGGCSTRSSVRLEGVGIPITSIRAIQCPLARALALWTRDAAQPAARAILGSRIIQIESFGSYSCRNVKGRPQFSGTRSEHATANAVDISGFVLSDGRRITVETGWNGQSDEQEFLRTVRAAACKRFQTVLSPDFNAAHHDHLHFDLGRGPFCR